MQAAAYNISFNVDKYTTLVKETIHKLLIVYCNNQSKTAV